MQRPHMRGGADDRYAKRRELIAEAGEKAPAIGREPPILAQPAKELGPAVAGQRR
jgi:hypothetical protein